MYSRMQCTAQLACDCLETLAILSCRDIPFYLRNTNTVEKGSISFETNCFRCSRKNISPETISRSKLEQ